MSAAMGRLLASALLMILPAPAAAQLLPGLARDEAGRTFIADIEAFLATCPQGDPALPEIIAAVKLRRNGASIDAVPCTDPAPLTQPGSSDLVHLQGLRVAYYMDQGRSGLYPWTAGGLFRWIGDNIAGINFIETGTTAAFCCQYFDGRAYVALRDEVPGLGTAIQWQNVQSALLLLAHEVRHRSGPGHVDCSRGPGACDAEFNPANLSSYGVQWWLMRIMLTGELNVGVNCSPFGSENATLSDLNLLNVIWRRTFVGDPPPIVPAPEAPYGPCRATAFVNAAPRSDATMIYYNASQPGWGISINHHPASDKVFAIWYTYDAQGNATWYVMPDMRPYAPGAWRGLGYRTSGPPYTTPRFDSRQVSVSPLGPVLIFLGPGRSGAFWPHMRSATHLLPVPIVKQDFPADSSPIASYNDLWWNPAESGWGISINQEARTLFAVWYTYDESRRPTWFVMPGGAWTDAAGTYAGSMYRTLCTIPCFREDGALDPASVLVMPAGTATLGFTDPSTGTFSSVVDGVARSRPIVRQPF